MSDFERDIVSRVGDAQRRHTADQQARDAAASRESAETELFEAELRRARVFGKEAVELLQGRGIASRSVYLNKKIGRGPVQSWGKYGINMIERDSWLWVEQGQGWVVYSRSHIGPEGNDYSTIGLQDNGALFVFGGDGVPGTPTRGALDKEKEGIRIKEYVDSDRAAQIASSDDFKNGVAHLISGLPLYNRITRY